MKKHCLLFIVTVTLFSPSLLHAQTSGELESYIKHLKEDQAGPLKETGFLSAGSDFLYGQGYYESKSYSSAEWYFTQALSKQKDNAFINYQLGMSLLKQNDPSKNTLAQEYFKAAFLLNASLRERYNTDVPAAANTESSKTNKETSLEDYIAQIKSSGVSGGAATSLGTAGYEALYGIGYYEANKFNNAETSFALSLHLDPSNTYVNYLMAVSLAAQAKKEAAVPFLQKASAKDPTLLQRFDRDVSNAKAWQKMADAKKIETTPSPKPVKGGKLISGNYTCHQSVWNGPNKSPAYSFKYKGYFELKADGSYRWLDNGASGKFSYDSKSGNITWLSGYLKTAGVKPSPYVINKETAQITLNFSDSNRWECGCKK